MILKGGTFSSVVRCKDSSSEGDIAPPSHSWEVVYSDSTAKSDCTGWLEGGEGGGNVSQMLAKEEPCYPCLLLMWGHPGLQQEQSKGRTRVHCSGDQALRPSELTGTAPWPFLLLACYNIPHDVTGSWLGAISPKGPWLAQFTSLLPMWLVSCCVYLQSDCHSTISTEHSLGTSRVPELGSHEALFSNLLSCPLLLPVSLWHPHGAKSNMKPLFPSGSWTP